MPKIDRPHRDRDSPSEDGIDQFVPKSKRDFETFVKLLRRKIERYCQSEHYHDFVSDLFRELCGKLDSEHIRRYGEELSALGAEKLKQEKEREKHKQKRRKSEKEPTLIITIDEDDDVVDAKPPDASVVEEKFEDSIGAYSPLLSAWDSVLGLKPTSSKVDSPKVPSCSTKEIEPKGQLINPLPSVIDKSETVSFPKAKPPRKSSPAPGPSDFDGSRKRPFQTTIDTDKCVIKHLESDDDDYEVFAPVKKPLLPKLIMPTARPQQREKTVPSPMISPNDSIFNESYDILKRPAKPIGEVVVRKKDERRQLQGHDCGNCRRYYDGLDLSPDSRAKRVNDISRHRTTYGPYKPQKTPEHFWEMDAPDTSELIRRGYLKQNF